MSLFTPKHEQWPSERFKDGYNARLIVRDGSFAELVENIRQYGILQSISALDNGVRIIGNRRYFAGLDAGLKLFPVNVYPSTLTEAQIRVINLSENGLRVDLSDPEIYAACSELMKLNTDWQRKDLASHLGKDPSTVTRWLCPADLVPEALAAFMAGKVSLTKAYSIVKSPDQHATLECSRSHPESGCSVYKAVQETAWKSGASVTFPAFD